MLTNSQRQWIAVGCVVVGAACGLAGGLSLGRSFLLYSSGRRLTEYSRDLSNYSLRYAAEVSNIWTTFSTSGQPICSSQQIEAMKALTFQSLQVKDVGLVYDGSVYCTAEGGRLRTPHTLPSKSMALANGGAFFPDTQLGGPPLHGPVIELNDVAVLVSPKAFDYWERPGLHYSVILMNDNTGHSARMAGETIPVLAGCRLGPGFEHSSSAVYRAAYTASDQVCAVSYEPIASILADNQQFLQAFAGMGCLVGLSLGLVGSVIVWRRGGLVQQLRRAIKKGELDVVYQPTFKLPSRRIVGAEALLRWNDPERGRIGPDVFVRIAQEAGFVHELTHFVLRRSMQEMGALLRDNPHFCLSVNVVATDLADDALYAQLFREVREAGILPGQLSVELTESSTADLETMRKVIDRLHGMGHEFHIDDFGTGFSSLSYLHELQADVIKIDRAFVRSCGTDAVTASILPQMLSMAESMGFEVIVEGLETEAQLRFLEAFRMPMRVQGFYLSRPVPAAAIKELMAVQLSLVESAATA